MKLKITQLSPGDWQAYRDIRLEALKSDPLAFGGTYEEECEKTEAQWRSFMANMWFALADDNVVGMIGLLRDTGFTGGHRAHLISMWVKPAYRGQGIGKQLVQYLQELAKTCSILKFYLHVTSTQEAAITLYESVGFKKVGVLKRHTRDENNYYDTYLMEWHAK